MTESREIILASKSPRRAQLLRQIGFAVQVRPSLIEESFQDGEDPAQHVRRLARAKAWQVAGAVRSGIVIGADTVVVLDDLILGKPRTREEAAEMLQKLSGRTHRVYTGFALVQRPGRRELADHETTSVSFRPLIEEEIRDYVASGAPMDKAGAYGIQDRSALFVSGIEGCFYNVVGFPLTRFYLRYLSFTRTGRGEEVFDPDR